jgi:soluble lytic murein transglycosylase-like protein
MVAKVLVRAEADYSVDALLLLAIIEHESHFRLRAKSAKGARGLMQVRPATASEVVGRRGIAYRRPEDLFDPTVNVAIGAAYMEELKESFGSWELALIAYHRGPKNLRKARAKGGPVRSRYASKVMKRYRRLQALCQSKSALLSRPRAAATEGIS